MHLASLMLALSPGRGCGWRKSIISHHMVLLLMSELLNFVPISAAPWTWNPLAPAADAEQGFAWVSTFITHCPTFNHLRGDWRVVTSERAPAGPGHFYLRECCAWASEARPSECTLSLQGDISHLGILLRPFEKQGESGELSGRLANENVFQSTTANLFPDQKHTLSFHPCSSAVAYFILDSPLFFTTAVEYIDWFSITYMYSGKPSRLQ